MGEGKPGPQEDLLRIEGPAGQTADEKFNAAINKALKKKRPAEGWPEREVQKRSKRRKPKKK